MIDHSLEILQKYWRHNQFRPLQREIINAVLAGNDTLALLPTGGGKSICFQVPAMQREGICIVISPLIALMKDQVENLRKKGMLAVAVHAGMSRSEIDIHLDNCIYGKVKFLYVSPERIQTEIFITRVKQMKVGLIAVDEAHCISQWGYDFRPSYLQLSVLRDIFPSVPVIALTATATPEVRDDIIKNLRFDKLHQVFQQTFARENLSFVVRETESKERKLLEVLQKVKGSVIIYVRSRKATQEIAEMLVKHGVSATYYHAGLSFEQRNQHQEDWIKNARRVMVATNAFGMGIDKPDVRIVVHLDLPETLEAYYQEAGRAGRDGKRSYAVVIFHQSDMESLHTKVLQSHPAVEYLKQIYQALANYYQLSVGSAESESFDFEIHDFCERFSLNVFEVYGALKKLEEEGLIEFNESFYSPSVLLITADKERLYEFQVANAQFDAIIKMVLRLYGGQLTSEFTKISELYLAKSLSVPVEEVVKQLNHLNELQLVVYRKAKDSPQVTFVLPRQDVRYLPLNTERIEFRKKLALSKMKAVEGFVKSTHQCRMQLIQIYFGEHTFQTCGKCDVCIAQKKLTNQQEEKELHEEILKIVNHNLLTIEQLEEKVAPKDSNLFIDVIREMVDDGVLEYDALWQLKIKNK